jgi:hypothetical protein
MRLPSIIILACLLQSAYAQYGSFNSTAVKAAKNSTTIVVLDGGSSPYDRAIMDAVKNHWRFTGNYEFVTMGELGAQPIAPEKSYLLKAVKVDPVKFEGTFLMLVQGWKAKKGDVLQARGSAFANIPETQELANILIDPKVIDEGNAPVLLGLYVKHLQDYLKLVETGKITDKATADRTYASRNRLIRDAELWMAKEHLDKSIPDAAKVKEFYTAPLKLVDMSQVIDAVERQDRSVAISDVVITSADHKNKHCFKRVFNAGSGELMYMGDDQAIFGKKEGFIDTDLKALERAR